MTYQTTQTIQTAVFDFDGTISTLRAGWEPVMRRLMLDTLLEYRRSDPAPSQFDNADVETVDAYIDRSTGIQTIHQMIWLSRQSAERAPHLQAPDPWQLKDAYNRRLMVEVERRRAAVRQDPTCTENYLIAGSVDFLIFLRSRGVTLYLASGTDQADVQYEAELLGVACYFHSINGAPERRVDCAKERIVRQLIDSSETDPHGLLVVGDGPVEIRTGLQAGARTLGIASDETRRRGVNTRKLLRLSEAGADRICGDFTDLEGIAAFCGFRQTDDKGRHR